jgi:hypothetical protein
MGTYGPPISTHTMTTSTSSAANNVSNATDDAMLVSGTYLIRGLRAPLHASQVIRKNGTFYFWLDGIHADNGLWAPLDMLQDKVSMGRMSDYIAKYPEEVNQAVFMIDQADVTPTPTLIVRTCEIARSEGVSIEEATSLCLNVGQTLWEMHQYPPVDTTDLLEPTGELEPSTPLTSPVASLTAGASMVPIRLSVSDLAALTGGAGRLWAVGQTKQAQGIKRASGPKGINGPKASKGTLNFQGLEPPKARPPKYGNRPSLSGDADELPFDSQHERRVYEQILWDMRADSRPADPSTDKVVKVERQVRFELLAAQKAAPPASRRSERAIFYVADFVLTCADGSRIVIDAKSAITRKHPVYVIKRKLMLFFHGISIVER